MPRKSRDSYVVSSVTPEALSFLLQRIADRLDRLEGIRGEFSVTESQVADGALLARVADDETIAGNWDFAAEAEFSDGATFDDVIVVPKASGKGIKIDPADPDWGWADIIGTPQEPSTAVGRPSWSQIASSGVFTWAFATADLQYYVWHLPHDLAINPDGTPTAIHFHVHWFNAQTAGAYTKWQFDYLYSKGHAQAAFPTTATTVYVEQQQATTAWTHMIAETDAVSISGLEPDGLIVCKVTRIAPAGTDVTGSVFVPVVDLHYQTNGIRGTKNKSPDFYT